jgi:hypothetical protein
MNRKRSETILGFKLAAAWLAIMAVIIGELLVYTWSRVQCIKIGYEITRATGVYEEQLALRKAMEVELALLTSPSRIIRQAQEGLGLVRPSPDQVVTIR